MMLDFTDELSSFSTEALEIGREEVGQQVTTDIVTIAQILLPRIQQFREKFNASYIDFVKETGIDRLQEAVKPDFAHGIQIVLRNKQVQGSQAENFAQVMYEGLLLLNEIRSMLTGTTIDNHFYYKSDDGRIIPINISKLKPVLSLYGASGSLSNPVSLAFQIEGEIIDLSEQIENAEEDKEHNLEHYLQIMERAKDIYVSKLNEKNKGKQYEKFWDNKDAEILELLIQRRAKTLAWNHYEKYRKQMGSAGKQTTLLQMGDIGSIQVKYFGQKQKSVNIMRFSMLRNSLFKLEEIFSLSNIKMQKQQLKEIFLPKTSELHDEFSREVNRSATEYFNSLFQNLI